LHTTRYREGLFFVCPECQGRAVTLPQLRRVAGDRYATALLRQMNRTTTFTRLCCPFCQSPMRAIVSAEPPLELDACKPCGVVWFDPREFEAVPEGALESPEAARLRGIEALAQRKLENLRQRGITDDGPDADWKAIPAFLGFPVESETAPLTRRPWVTWGLTVVILLVSVMAFFNHRPMVEAFGLVPAQAWRWGGLTWVTSFFLHGGALHLLGNLYFLLIFGDNVEDFLGRWRYALMLLAATVAGDAVHVLMDPRSMVPCIGASGGISGVIVFYALQFPRARLGFLMRYFFFFRWVQIPAWGALGLWLLLQSVGLMQQIMGASSVAATAHLGGAAAGFVAWWWWRRTEKRPLLAD
jgi:membrane associated rhomboid family serine protease/Zn-finger nucleic acid-binding protein